MSYLSSNGLIDTKVPFFDKLLNLTNKEVFK